MPRIVIVTKKNNWNLRIYISYFKDDLSNAIQENLEEDETPLTHLMEAFGPGTFSTPEEMASDEENDAKLWVDIVESIKNWQQNKVFKIQQRKRGLHR